MTERNVLITLLGRSEKKDGGYRETSYRFPDGSISDPVAFLGWELRQRANPDKIIVLGTPGSMWDWLIEPVASLDQDRYLSLIESVEAKCVTDEQVQFFAPQLSGALNAQIDLQIIAEGQTQEEQLALLTRIAPLIEDGDVLTLDLTHGFRHLPILLLMAVVYLRSIRSIAVQAVYSSFYDADTQQGVVFNMSGLLKLFDWHSALNAFDKDGDPGVFAELLGDEGLVRDALQKLRGASYNSRVHRHEAAWKAERAVANELDREKLSGVGTLFAPYLKDKLGSKGESDRARRLARMARKQLELGSYDRAVLLGLAAAQAACAKPGENLSDVHEEIIGGTRSIPSAEEYGVLNSVRNAIAHTNDKAHSKLANAIMKNEETMRAGLQNLFDRLFEGVK